MSIEEHVFDYKDIIVGSSLPALFHSFYNNIPIIYTYLDRPHIAEEFDLSIKEHKDILDAFHYDYEGKDRIKKLHLWSIIYFILGVRGLNLLSGKGKLIRISDNLIKAITLNARMSKFKLNKVHFWMEESILGLSDIVENIEKEYDVLDFFDITEVDESFPEDKVIKFEEESFKSSLFLKKKKKNRFKMLPYAYTVTRMTKKQLEDNEFTDIQARFKLMRDLQDLNLAGQVEHIRREKFLKSRNVYEETGNFSFYNLTDVESFQRFYKSKGKNISLLKEMKFGTEI